MKLEQALEIQSLVDGQLTSGRRQEVERLVCEVLGAGALAAELRSVKNAVAAHEPAGTVPESREFYWSQIRRRIAAQETVGANAKPRVFVLSWIRWLAPALGVAAVAAMIAMRSGSQTALADASVMTFHSDADALTIHWLN